MTSQEKSSKPASIFGILQPGERTRRAFSAPLGNEYAALLQRIPNSGVRIAEQSAEWIELENTGASIAPYWVIFMSKALLGALWHGKEAIGYIWGQGKGSKP